MERSRRRAALVSAAGSAEGKQRVQRKTKGPWVLWLLLWLVIKHFERKIREWESPEISAEESADEAPLHHRPRRPAAPAAR